MPLDKQQLNRNIRAELARKGMAQADIAVLLDLSTPSVSHRFTGKKDWSLPELVAVADWLGVPMTALIPDGVAA